MVVDWICFGVLAGTAVYSEMVVVEHKDSIDKAVEIGPDLVATEKEGSGRVDMEALVIVVTLVEMEIGVSMESQGHFVGIGENTAGDSVFGSGPSDHDC